MRFSPDGKALLGIGGATDNVSVDGVVPSGLSGMAGGGWGWLDADTIAGPGDFGGGYALWSYVLSTDTLTQIGDGGATVFAAGGGVWARQLVDGAGVSTVETSIANFGPFQLSGPVDIDSQGRVALVLDYQAGRGLRSYTPAGTFLAAADIQFSGALKVWARDGLVAYQDAQGWHLWNMANGTLAPFAPRTDVTVSWMVPVIIGSATYVLERSDDQLSFRRATAGTAFILGTGNQLFNPDVVFASGVVYIGWTTTEGEAPDEFRGWRGTVNGVGQTGTTASGSLVWTDAPRLRPEAVSIGPVEGGSRAAIIAGLEQHPVVDRASLRITPEWWKSLSALAGRVSAPTDLSYVDGVLPQEHGGTGQQTGTTVLNASNVTLGHLPQNVKWRSYTLSLTGTQNDVGFQSADFIRCDNGSALTVTGLSAGVAGQRLVIAATTANAVTLANEHAGSVAANRLLTFSGSDVELGENEGALLEYDGVTERWRVLFVSAAESGGDVVGPASSEDGAVALFDGVTGKLLKEATQTGIAYVQSGVLKTCDVSVLTNGNPSSPELMWDSNGDVMMTLQIH